MFIIMHRMIIIAGQPFLHYPRSTNCIGRGTRDTYYDSNLPTYTNVSKGMQYMKGSLVLSTHIFKYSRVWKMRGYNYESLIPRLSDSPSIYEHYRQINLISRCNFNPSFSTNLVKLRTWEIRARCRKSSTVSKEMTSALSRDLAKMLHEFSVNFLLTKFFGFT